MTIITASTPRDDVQVTMRDGTVWRGPSGSSLEEFFRVAYPQYMPGHNHKAAKDMIVGAFINGTLRELMYPVSDDCRVEPISISMSDGLRIYRRALSMLLLVAAYQLYPDRQINIDHSLPFGGYYCNTESGEPFSPTEIENIKALMREIVEADERFTKRAVPLDEAVSIFEKQGYDDKLRLLKARKKDYLNLYEMRGLHDYFYGYMVPSAGYLQVFDLTPDGDGFILHYPRRREPTTIQPIADLPKLRAVFHQARDWLNLLGVPDIGALNGYIRQGRAQDLILVAEALHESRYADIADMIVDRFHRDGARLVLIAGPSSAGKTTSSKRLAVQLQAHGLKPFTLEVDNYFVDRERTPLDDDGGYDFEHLNAVDLDMLNDHIVRLISNERVQLPYFDFRTGFQEKGEAVQLTPEHVIIMEGIHGLNPELVRDVPTEKAFRLFVSCLTQLNIDRHNRVPTTDVRLLRRMVRDAQFRGHNAQATIARWQSVRAGERKWIFPYQENAEVIFNSALMYELAILRPLAEPLLRQVDPVSPHYVEAKRLLAFLSWVEPLDYEDLMPSNSILREFIGGSILESYRPGLSALK